MLEDEKIVVLKEKFQLGFSGAKRLLTRADGDLSKAILLFQTDMLNVVKSRLSFETSNENIVNHLVLNNYDFSKTLNSLLEEKYTLTERILLREKDANSALDKILYSIEVEDNINRNFWLNLDDLTKLNPYRYCLATILEWTNFAGWEGFDYAVSNFEWTKIVIQQIRENLQMIDLADIIEESLIKTEEHYKNCKQSKKGLSFPDLEKESDYYDNSEKSIYIALCEYVKLNIQFFPR